MSIKLMTQVWEIDDPELNGARLLTLLSLADHADDEGGNCYPSIPRLAKRARVSDRQAKRVIQWLEERGYIQIVEKGNGRGHSTRYRIVLKGDALSLNTRNKGDVVSSYSHKKHDTVSPIESVKGDTQRVKGDICDIKGDIAMSPDPSVDPSIDPSEGEENAADAASTSTPQQEMFAAVCQAVGWDHHTLTDKDRGRVAQTVGILSKANYTPADIACFMTEHWVHDWRWQKNRSFPTLSQLRQEIGKIRTPVPSFPKSNGYDKQSTPAHNMNAVAEYLEIIRRQS